MAISNPACLPDFINFSSAQRCDHCLVVIKLLTTDVEFGLKFIFTARRQYA